VEFLLDYEERNTGNKGEVVYPRNFKEYSKRYEYLERYGDSEHLQMREEIFKN